jgi:hypothetical protein
MEILKDIGRFIWAVLSIWQAYMTGGIVIALLGLYERLTKKTISLRTFIIGVIAFLLAAFFLAWRDQYRGRLDTEIRIKELSNPDLTGQIEFFSGGGNPAGAPVLTKDTFMFLLIRIWNTGAPSVIRELKTTVKTPGGRLVEGSPMIIPGSIRMTDKDGHEIAYSMKDSLIVKAAETPIPRNGSAEGFVIVAFKDLPKEEVIQRGSVITFFFKDINQKEYQAIHTITLGKWPYLDLKDIK